MYNSSPVHGRMVAHIPEQRGVTLIDVMMQTHGYTLMAVPARYARGDTVVALGYSEEITHDLMTRYSDGDAENAAVETFEREMVNYPIARGKTISEALSKLEAKLESIRIEQINSNEWRHSIDLVLSDFVYPKR